MQLPNSKLVMDFEEILRKAMGLGSGPISGQRRSSSDASGGALDAGPAYEASVDFAKQYGDGPKFLRVKSLYRVPKPAPTFKATPKVKPEIPEAYYSARDLSPGDQISLEILKKLGARLEQKFSLSQLKSEWKFLAKKFHPDAAPEQDAKYFVAAKKHYELIRTALLDKKSEKDAA